MYAVTRTYAGRGAKELFDVLAEHKSDVESIMRSIKGFVSYTLARTKDGGISLTVCETGAGVEESVEKARDWIARNAAGTGAGAPTISEGSVVLHLR